MAHIGTALNFNRFLVYYRMDIEFNNSNKGFSDE